MVTTTKTRSAQSKTSGHGEQINGDKNRYDKRNDSGYMRLNFSSRDQKK